MAQPIYKTETDILHSVATNPDCSWIWTDHALKKMALRHISAPDVQEALTNGHIELIERKADDVARVRGKDLDGCGLVVACVVFENSITIKIITTF